MKRLLAELAAVWSVLLKRVDVGPRQCRACHRTCTQVPRSTYDAWQWAQHYELPPEVDSQGKLKSYLMQAYLPQAVAQLGDSAATTTFDAERARVRRRAPSR